MADRIKKGGFMLRRSQQNILFVLLIISICAMTLKALRMNGGFVSQADRDLRIFRQYCEQMEQQFNERMSLLEQGDIPKLRYLEKEVLSQNELLTSLEEDLEDHRHRS